MGGSIHGGTSKIDGLLGDNPNLKWMITGGTPIYGNIQMGISPSSEGLVGLDMTHLKWGGHPS